jgi:hypothetical protein
MFEDLSTPAVKIETPDGVFYRWNTGRFYSDLGQRIVATMLPDGRIAFVDLDRGIDGLTNIVLDKADYAPHVIQQIVMGDYDYGRYTGLYSLPDRRGLLGSLESAWDYCAPAAPEPITLTINHRTVKDVNADCSAAYQECLREAKRSIGKGCYRSRGRFVCVYLVDGGIWHETEGEAMSWEGTAAQFDKLRDLFNNNNKIESIGIFGAVDYAESLRDFTDCCYDPIVNEWDIELFNRKGK